MPSVVRIPSTSLAALLLAALLVPTSPAAEGDYEKGQVTWRMKSVAADSAEILDRYQRWKADGKLEDQQKRSDLQGQATTLWMNIGENYAKAASAGAPAQDPVMAEAKAKLEELRPKFEVMGFWTSWAFGEPMIHERYALDNCRRLGWEAAWLALRSGDELEEARGNWATIDRHLQDLLKKSKDKPDDPRSQATPNLEGQPSWKRTADELAQLRATCQVSFEKTDAARLAVAKDFRAVVDLKDWFMKLEDGAQWQLLHNRSSGCNATDLEKLERFERDVRPKLEVGLKQYAAKYPLEQDAWYKVVEKAFGKTWRQYSDEHGLGNTRGAYEDLQRAIETAPVIRKDCGESLARTVESDVSNLGAYADSALTTVFQRLSENVALGLRYDPQNAALLRAKATLAPREAEMRAAIEKKIDDFRLPPSILDYKGPGTLATLTQAAKEFFDQSSDWGRNERPYQMVAIAFTGQWDSGEKNLIGETIQWGIPFVAAFYRPKSDDPSLIAVYEGELFGVKERGIQPGPPFRGYSHRDPVRMRAANLPAGSLGGGGSPAAGGGTLALGFWLGLVAVNLLAGLLAARALLEPKVPQLVGFYAGTAPLRALVGVAALALGLLAFLRATLLWFSPLADLFPQLAAVAAGLVLGKEMLLTRGEATAPVPEAAPAPGEEAPAEGPPAAGSSDAQEKVAAAVGAAADGAQKAALAAQELLIQNREKIERLETLQVPLGIACLVAGLLHLLVPGMPLL